MMEIIKRNIFYRYWFSANLVFSDLLALIISWLLLFQILSYLGFKFTFIHTALLDKLSTRNLVLVIIFLACNLFLCRYAQFHKSNLKRKFLWSTVYISVPSGILSYLLFIENIKFYLIFIFVSTFLIMIASFSIYFEYFSKAFFQSLLALRRARIRPFAIWVWIQLTFIFFILTKMLFSSVGVKVLSLVLFIAPVSLVILVSCTPSGHYHNMLYFSKAGLKSLHLAGAVLVALILLATGIIKGFNIESTGLNISGPQLFSYNLSRLYLVIALAISFYSMGCITLRFFFENRSILAVTSPFCNVLPAFFLGASTLGFIFAVLGLFGFLKTEIALLTVAPLLYIAPHYLLPIIREAFRSIKLEVKESSALDITTRILLWWCLIIGVIWVILFNGLYPLAGDGDVWVHYIHYQRSVISSGTTLPGEVWYHFYLSKGAGLNFLAGLLSDGLSSQIVSIIFYVITTYTVFAISIAAGVGLNLSILSSIIFITIFDGQFYKHHVVVTSYISFLFWIAVHLLKREDANRNRILLISGAVSTTYLGFFQPLQASIPFAFFSLLWAVSLLSKDLRKSSTKILLLALATFFGALFSITLNYLFTGLVEHVPLGLTWAAANMNRFRQVFSSLGISFVLFDQANFKPFESSYINWDWLIDCFRISRVIQIVNFELISVFCIFVLLSLKRSISQIQLVSIFYVIISGLAILVPTVYLANHLQTLSTYRILTFTSVFLSVALVLPLHLMMNGVGYGIMNRTLYCLFLLFIASWFIVYLVDIQPKARSKQIGQFLFGEASLLTAMRRETLETSNFNIISLLSRVRNSQGHSVRIWSLVQPSDPSMAFPAPGLMSEPSYDLGPDHLEIVMGEPENAVDILKRHNVNYFFLPLGSDTFLPFSSLLFSNLFSPANVQKYFMVQEKSGLNYILTWRTEGKDPLPKGLLHLLDFYRNDTINYYFRRGSEFEKNIKSIVSENLSLYNFESVQFNNSVVADIKRLLLDRVESTTEYTPNRILLSGIVDQISIDLSNYIFSLKTEADASKVAARVLAIIRSDIEIKMISFIGPEAVDMTLKNSRVPYGNIIDERLKSK